MGNDNELLSATDQEQFITNYKAVYNAMTAKQDCKSKIFPRNVVITKDDIFELNYRITQKLRNYKDAGFTINVTASYEGRQSKEFSSWLEFENHTWNESDALNSIVIIWEFNAVLPQFQLPQKHVLVVKMTDGLRPEEMINIVFAGKLENIQDIEKQMYPVVARVDFINNVLGDELLQIVNDWNKGLQLQEYGEEKYSRFVVKNKRKIAFLLNYFTRFVTLWCCARIISNYIKSFDASLLSDITTGNLCNLVWIIVMLFFGYLVVNKISEWLSNVFFHTLNKERPTHVFNINKGDINIQKTLEKEFAKNRTLTVISVVGTFVLNLLCTIISNVICGGFN